MQGEYRGDFTRDTFWRANHFCQVLMQQGRIQLDADWNEQSAITLHFLRSLARDVIGQFGGSSATGFLINTDADAPNDLTIGPGHYYVDGILCEFEVPVGAIDATSPGLTYLTQPDWPNPTALPPGPGIALAYLDVWERHVTAMQQGSIREVALGGPDTASRAKVVCQVKIEPNVPANLNSGAAIYKNWPSLVRHWQGPNRGFLSARLQPQQTSTDPCVISPQSTYRGTENQLYRVEIHYGSGDVDLNGVRLGPTFKWSRENGSVALPILNLATANGKTTVVLANLGRDPRLSLKANDWVEVGDDTSSLSGKVDSLLKVLHVEGSAQTVTLDGVSTVTVKQPSTLHPLLRRWEGKGSVVEDSNNWINLEDGLQIQFPSPAQGTIVSQYRSGDYWLIPARVGLGTADGTIDWPQQTDAQGNVSAAALPPRGIEHHYAPLALFTPGQQPTDIRRIFKPLADQ